MVLRISAYTTHITDVISFTIKYLALASHHVGYLTILKWVCVDRIDDRDSLYIYIKKHPGTDLSMSFIRYIEEKMAGDITIEILGDIEAKKLLEEFIN